MPEGKADPSETLDEAIERLVSSLLTGCTDRIDGCSCGQRGVTMTECCDNCEAATLIELLNKRVKNLARKLVSSDRDWIVAFNHQEAIGR